MSFDETIQDQVVGDSNINSLEKYKFFVDADGLLRTRTSASPSGLRTGGRLTNLTLTDGTWVNIPTTSLLNRNTVGIQNESGNFIYVQFDFDGDPNTEGYTTGWKVKDGGEFFMDVKDGIDIWVLPETGSTPLITIMELA